MKFEIDQAVFELFPTIIVGIVTGEINSLKEGYHDKLTLMQNDVLNRLAFLNLDTTTLSNYPHIQAWREIYQKFGVKAKRHKPTHEALVRRLLKDGTWPNINPVVDVYLTNQAYHVLPHGGYDAEKLSGNIRLSVSQGDELFKPLGGGDEYTSVGEVIYRDDKEILTRRWNYRDCDATKITEETERFVIMIEATTNKIEAFAVEEAAKELAKRYSRCFAGKFGVQVFFATKNNDSIHMQL